MASNRGVVYMGSQKLEVKDLDSPKLVDPRGNKCNHGVILKIVTTNICGSNQHIYRGRFVAPQGMVLGHEITGEVIEVGPDVEFMKVGDLVSVPFNVACGRCRNCKERHTEVCMNVNPDADCGVDAVGFEAHGHGSASREEEPEAVINSLMAVVRSGSGGIDIPGIYSQGDPYTKTEAAKQGKLSLDFGMAWIKSPKLIGGQAPTMKYSRELMMAILWGRMPYLSEVMNTTVITLDQAVEAYQVFDQGSPKKFVIDPHNSTKKVA